jgi:hypothetical protein
VPGGKLQLALGHAAHAAFAVFGAIQTDPQFRQRGIFVPAKIHSRCKWFREFNRPVTGTVVSSLPGPLRPNQALITPLRFARQTNAGGRAPVSRFVELRPQPVLQTT